MADAKLKNKKKKTWRRLFSYIRRYLPQLVMTIVFAGVTVVLSLYIPILCGRAIDGMLGEVDFERIRDCLVRIGLCAGLCGILQWVMNAVNNHITFSVVRDVRRDAFWHMTRLPLSYLDSHPHGTVVSRIISDVDQFADGLLLGFTQFFTGLMTVLCTLVFMLTIHPLITWVVVLLTPLSLCIAAFIAKKTFAMFRLRSETNGELTAQINETIAGQDVIRAFSQEKETLRRFDEINERLERCSLRAIFFSSITNPSTRFINNLVYAAVCLTGALACISGTMTAGGLTSFLTYANQYTKPFNEISGVITELQNALACAERIFDLLDEPTYEPDAPQAEALTAVRGELCMKDVDFSYDPERELIRHLHLTVQPGETVAIVGPTGCGKTTLMNLLLRFYEVNAGEIFVDGRELHTIQRKSLHGLYGMVLQDTWMMHGTVRENIRMGREATEEEIVAAAKAAHAHSFIRRLPQGYDTVISEDSGGLSAGQRQLLCIARVMLALPPMLILDEATSSIDTRTEMKIQRAFATMMQGRTTFVVAHRLSTIREADMILVMRNGTIVERGRHEELLQAGGFYAHLWGSQFEPVEQSVSI